ncbi:hypothetical protein G7Y79_00012g031600 [Physcia stellaris]|nr:hypothetical protein G7Y79_00012g031600 [Physcia stellaris]
MARSHHETTPPGPPTPVEQRLRTLRANVDRMLHEINDNSPDESFADQSKRRRSVPTAESIGVEDDEATHPLNIVTTGQLKWWANHRAADFLKEFDRLRTDRDNYLDALAQYQNLYNIASADRDELVNTNAELDEVRRELDTLKSEYERQRDLLLTKQKDYTLLKKDHDALLAKTRGRARGPGAGDEGSDGEASVISSSQKNKRRSKAHPDPPKFTDGVEPTWRVWKTKVHDKMTANADHYDTDMIAATTVIGWTEGDAGGHIQSVRDIDMDHFRTWHMVLEFLGTIYEDPDFKRNMRNQFRALTMGTQDFQSFYSTFLRLSNPTGYSEATKIEELMDKISWNLKEAMSVYPREFTTLDEARTTLQQIYNRQSSLRKEKTAARQQRPELPQSRSTPVASTPVPFTKPATPAPFVKPAAHFHPSAETKTRDPVTDKLAATGKCFTCGETGHVWRECPNAHKHQERHWHKMQVSYMDMASESSGSDSEN